MNRPRMMQMGAVVVLAEALVTGGAFAQSTTPPAGSAQPAPMAPGMPRGPMSHGGMPHGPMALASTAGEPTLPGQDAFGAISEIVRILDADPRTDWSKVDVERLREHLIDMNEVVLRSAVRQTPVPGGLAMETTGTGRTEQAIRAMVVPHAVELDRMAEWSASTEPIPNGIRLTVTAKTPDDTKLVARIRGLGFAGLITEGAHHQPHHLAMAKGEAMAGHSHWLPSAEAQHAMPPAVPGGPSAHMLAEACATAFETNIATGRGFSTAFVADHHGYPGPLHVLELKDRLKLSAEQEATVQAMMGAVFAESRPKSARLLEAEAKLRQLFASGQADEAAVRAAVAEVEKTRTEVRLAHLMAHLKMRHVLTEEQRRVYQEARWSAHRAMGPHGGGSPGAGTLTK